MDQPQRSLPIGAELQVGGGAHFRVWAPLRQQVQVILEPQYDAVDVRARAFLLQSEGNGYFSGFVAEAQADTLYRFRVDDEPLLYPDPASRFQPEGVHGPSSIVDYRSYRWQDQAWRGVTLEGQVIYELHLGTFTREGTWESALRELPELKALGITLLEVMPVAEFPGRFGWGYDGVNLFAPTRLYGTPDDFRRFVDAAHRIGLGVILDVVYNHFGPSGNYLAAFSKDYVHRERTTEWGESINFDEENSGPVREFFIANAGYWTREFHLDGLRLDATQAIHDASSPHILLEISRQVHQAAEGRGTLIFSENERQEAQQVRTPEQGGYALDATWNDDFHHSTRVALSGQSEFYYADYRGTPQELLSAVKHGFLFQGQRSRVQGHRRGTPCLDIPARQFVIFLQNHDQVANSARGWRIHQLTSSGRYRALTALMLLSPNTPLLFQGQEFAASSPFLYFADHETHLAQSVRQGRFDFLRKFGRAAAEEMASILDDPENIATFERSKLDLSEREKHPETYSLHRDLLKLRREDPIIRAQRGDRLDGAVLANEAFCLRFFGEAFDDRLLVVNLGGDLQYEPPSEPLLAPPWNRQWQILWSSEHPSYGGSGTPALETDGSWWFPAHAAVLLIAVDQPKTA